MHTYLSTVRYLHIINNLPKPLTRCLKLDLVLAGIKHLHHPQKVVHLPIKPLMLRTIHNNLHHSSEAQYIKKMIWAAYSMGYFGFTRSGELTVPTLSAYDPAKDLSPCDMMIDSHQNPQLMSIFLCHSKTPQGDICLPVLRMGPNLLCQWADSWCEPF